MYALIERPKSASDSIADTIKTGWKKWEDERCYGGSGGGRRKGRAFLSFCMFLDEMFDDLCLIFADVRRFSQICISAFLHLCLSACSMMFARIIS